MGHNSVSGKQHDGSWKRRVSPRLDHVHSEDSPKDTFLHGQPHHSLCPHIVPECLRFLLASRRRRKDDNVYLHPNLLHTFCCIYIYLILITFKLYSSRTLFYACYCVSYVL